MSPEGAALAQHIRDKGASAARADLCARLPCDGAAKAVVALQDIKAGETLDEYR